MYPKCVSCLGYFLRRQTARLFGLSGSCDCVLMRFRVAPEFPPSPYLVTVPSPQGDMSQHPIPSGRGSIAGRVLLEGRTMHVPDVMADLEYEYKAGAKAGGIGTMLGVPLVRESSPIGVLMLLRRGRSPFTDKQVELAETFADQAAIAIENARLLNELRESLEQQTATSDVLRVISSSPADIQPVLETISERAEKLCMRRSVAYPLSTANLSVWRRSMA